VAEESLAVARHRMVKDEVEEERLDERIPQAAMLEPGLGLHIACTGR